MAALLSSVSLALSSGCPESTNRRTPANDDQPSRRPETAADGHVRGGEGCLSAVPACEASHGVLWSDHLREYFVTADFELQNSNRPAIMQPAKWSVARYLTARFHQTDHELHEHLDFALQIHDGLQHGQGERESVASGSALQDQQTDRAVHYRRIAKAAHLLTAHLWRDQKQTELPDTVFPDAVLLLLSIGLVLPRELHEHADQLPERQRLPARDLRRQSVEGSVQGAGRTAVLPDDDLLLFAAL